MRKSSLIILLAGSALALATGSITFDEVEARTMASSATALLKLAQQGQHSHEGHDHDDRGRSGHKEHNGDRDHDGHKDHSDHKEQESEKDHDDHKDHDHGPTEKRSKMDHDHDHGKPEHAHKAGEAAQHDETGHKHSEGEKDKHGHAGHAHGDDEHSDVVKLTPEQRKEFEILTEQVKSGTIASMIVRPAEIKFNKDHVAHVVPRVAGVVRKVTISEGDKIEMGTVMAVLDSRELADAKATFLAAYERKQLARETFEREEGLWKQKISSEKEYLDAKTAYAERRIELRAASQKLRALGFERDYLKQLAQSDDDTLTEYRLVAPFSGTVISRHISRGEAVGSESDAFLLADLAELWVDITIYPKDLGIVRQGQKVHIDLEDGGPPARGSIAFVTPNVSEETRTAYARAKLSNANGRLRPGTFVKAEIEVGAASASIRIPQSAVQRVNERSVVFVGKDGAFSPRPVTVGRKNEKFAEILSGLKPGETYVSRGAFTLKAQLSKESFGDGHNH